MKNIVIAGLGVSIAASANYFADRLHTQVDNLLSKDMDLRSVSLTIRQSDMVMMREIAQQSAEQSFGLSSLLSPERVKNGRLSLSLQQAEQVFVSASLLA